MVLGCCIFFCQPIFWSSWCFCCLRYSMIQHKNIHKLFDQVKHVLQMLIESMRPSLPTLGWVPYGFKASDLCSTRCQQCQRLRSATHQLLNGQAANDPFWNGRSQCPAWVQNPFPRWSEISSILQHLHMVRWCFWAFRSCMALIRNSRWIRRPC